MFPIYRQFSDDKGVSQIHRVPEELLTQLTQWQAAKGWRIHVHPPGTFLDWHPAGGRYVIAVLSGSIDIGTSDGEIMHCEPGTLRMTSDSGKGHTGRVTGDEPCCVLMIDIGV